jgi:hypothetical protein
MGPRHSSHIGWLTSLTGILQDDGGIEYHDNGEL